MTIRFPGSMAKERKARRLSFSMNEIMSGEHEFEPGFGEPGKRPMEFRARWGSDDLVRWINPMSDGFLFSDLDGVVTIDGLCEAARCTGSLELRYFKDQTVRYAFEFEAAGVPYRYVGEKVAIRPWNLAWSHTTCFGRLVKRDTGELISTSVTHFKLRGIPAFLASLRFSLARPPVASRRPARGSRSARRKRRAGPPPSPRAR